MKTKITKDTHQLLFCLFQASALYETLEDFEENHLFVKDLKQHVNNFKRKLNSSLVRHLDTAHGIDPKDFITYDTVIQKSVKQFSHKAFKSFFIIED
jgi:chromosome condensin MukBEF MukE localization factor